MKFRYDYTKTMIMKMNLSMPDGMGGSIVMCDFTSALERIKSLDILTVGAPKIIYLVGWQYNGGNDKCPAFFEVNKALKRPEDSTALESMLWLINEAKQYNTVVSIQINLSDVYKNSTLFADYVINKALIRNSAGNATAVEKHGNARCFKVSYKEEWESGLFKQRIDKLLSIVPLREIGTLHVDNFQCYSNASPKVSSYEMQIYRNKMVDYFTEQGIDLTLESIYREGPLTTVRIGSFVFNKPKNIYPIDMLFKIPAVWNISNVSAEELMKYYPHTICGGMIANKHYSEALYGNIHCDDIWNGSKTDIIRKISEQFSLINVPYFYLNAKLKKSYNEDKNGLVIEYSDGTVSNGKKNEIKICGKVLKSDSFVCLPIFWQENCYYAYSKIHGKKTLYIGGKTAAISEIHPDRLEFMGVYDIHDGKIDFQMEGETAYFIQT